MISLLEEWWLQIDCPATCLIIRLPGFAKLRLWWAILRWFIFFYWMIGVCCWWPWYFPQLPVSHFDSPGRGSWPFGYHCCIFEVLPQAPKFIGEASLNFSEALRWPSRFFRSHLSSISAFQQVLYTISHLCLQFFAFLKVSSLGHHNLDPLFTAAQVLM